MYWSEYILILLYPQVLLEIVICVGLVKFLQLSLTLCGGQDGLISSCAHKGILLPVGSPPIVCLLPCTKPAITKYNLSWVMLGPNVLLGAKALILVVDLIYLSVDYTPSGEFVSFDNIHNLLAFPVGLGAIYCLNIYLVIINECLAGNSKRLIGLILVLEFILFDCLRLFFIFLTGKIIFISWWMVHFSIHRHWHAHMSPSIPQSGHGCPSSQEYHEGIPRYLHGHSLYQPLCTESWTYK